MKTIKVYMTDAFSKATTVHEQTVSEDQLEKIKIAHTTKAIINQFENNINWSWIIDKIEMV